MIKRVPMFGHCAICYERCSLCFIRFSLHNFTGEREYTHSAEQENETPKEAKISQGLGMVGGSSRNSDPIGIL